MNVPRLGIPSLLAIGAALLAAHAPSTAAVVLLNDLLTNPSFEGGTQANGCPVGWTCPNQNTLTIGVSSPTAAQYPTPNGLTPPAVTPGGQFAAFTPLAPNSNGQIFQSIAGQSYTAGNTYVLDFWLGNPLGGQYPSRIDVQLLAGLATSSQTNGLCDTAGRNSTLVSGAQSANDNGTQCLFSFGPASWQPADGDWREYMLTFTTNATIVGDIGVQFTVFGQASAGNGMLMHLDLTASPVSQSVPEPATLSLVGLALLGIVGLRRNALST